MGFWSRKTEGALNFKYKTKKLPSFSFSSSLDSHRLEILPENSRSAHRLINHPRTCRKKSILSWLPSNFHFLLPHIGKMGIAFLFLIREYILKSWQQLKRTQVLLLTHTQPPYAPVHRSGNCTGAAEAAAHLMLEKNHVCHDRSIIQWQLSHISCKVVVHGKLLEHKEQIIG